MRVIISTDLEGISGVCVWEQTREMTTAHYQDARRLLMGDIRAAWPPGNPDARRQVSLV